MGWNVYLECPTCKGSVEVDCHTEGSTYAIGGTDQADIAITYNYNQFFREALGGGFEETIDGKIASDVTGLLEDAVGKLGTERDGDYWKPTPGNAGYALSILLKWARQHPYGIFQVH